MTTALPASEVGGPTRASPLSYPEGEYTLVLPPQPVKEIDRYKAEASHSMKHTVKTLGGQVSRARPQLERCHSSDAATIHPPRN